MTAEQFYRRLFLFAAAYNITVGGAVMLFPQTFFRLFSLPEINHAYVMQGLGMFVAVYGVGFYFVFKDPKNNSAFAILGLAGKTLGVLGWIYYTVRGDIPIAAIGANILNDLLWIPPFIAYLRWRAKISS